jgi:glycosyltransferase involved in cell wall biosynthesis
MKIVQIISSLGNGGAERLVVDLSNELSKFEEVIICTFRDITAEMFFVSELVPEVKIVSLSKKKGFDLKFFIRLIRFLFQEKPEIINSHLASTVRYLYFSLIFLRNMSAFHTMHAPAQEEETIKFFRFVKYIFFRIGLIRPITISEVTDESFNNYYPKVKSNLIKNGVIKRKLTKFHESTIHEIESYKKNSKTKVFLSVGRIDPNRNDKNFEMMVEVFQRFYERTENVILIIIGKDISKNQNGIAGLNKLKAENTFFVGPKSNIGDYLSCADALCISSRLEGLPIILLEAFSFGLPVISTPVGGIPNVLINQVNGFLSEDITSESFLLALQTFLSTSENEVKIISQNNHTKFVEQFDIKIIAEKYYNLYKQ